MRKNFFSKLVAIAVGVSLMVPYSGMAAELNVKEEVENSTVYLGENDWDLVWSDEFNGNQLDTTKWSYQIGNGYNGWGNYEKQYYTKENVTVSDGTLKITAKKENKNGFEYTSSRIRTVTDSGQTLFATKYGKIEAKIKLPAGTGLWPAFWMMPVDSEYGSWPLSGEIDIMEARGRVLNEINGTIHFVEKRPFNRSIGGSYVFDSTTDITDYHVYAVEWKENTIIWYVDGIEYYRTSNWYTMDDGVVAEYPAPFNKEFYLILNMAVGGTYDSQRVPSDSEVPGTMEVDYVRVYHSKDGYSSENIYMPEGTRDENAMANTPIYKDGNLLADIDFDNINTVLKHKDEVDLSLPTWYALYNKYMPASANITKEKIGNDTFVKYDIIDPGTQTYSLQLKQTVPLAKGFVYKVSFDAKCDDGARTIKVKPYGVQNYNDSYTANLTKDVQNFEFSFLMEYDTDMNATLEFNIGKLAGDVSIGNVKVEVVNTYVESEKVESSNQAKPAIKQAIENGDFSQGLSVWNVFGTYYALEEKNGNVYGKIYTKHKDNPWDRMWIQSGIYLTEGKTYKIEFMAKSSENNQKFAVVVEDNLYAKSLYSEFVAGKDWKKYSYEFVAKTEEELTLKYFLGMVDKDCKLYLDDVSITIVE